MAVTSKSTNNTCWPSMWRQGSPSALMVGLQIDTATMENRIEFPQKIKNGPAALTGQLSWLSTIPAPKGCKFNPSQGLWYARGN